MTAIETIEQPVTSHGGTDNTPEVAHLCRKEDVARAYVTGEAIEALCGHIWVPSRDPEQYPVCPRCVEERDRLNNAGGN